MIKNNGGATDYYSTPKDNTTLCDLIEHKGMSHGIGEAFAALYRLYDKDTEERNLNKAKFYIERRIAEIKAKEPKDVQIMDRNRRLKDRI